MFGVDNPSCAYSLLGGDYFAVYFRAWSISLVESREMSKNNHGVEFDWFGKKSAYVFWFCIYVCFGSVFLPQNAGAFEGSIRWQCIEEDVAFKPEGKAFALGGFLH